MATINEITTIDGEVVGRILRWNSERSSGEIEAAPGVLSGELVCFRDPRGHTAVCRVVGIMNHGPISGIKAAISLVGSNCGVPAPMTNIHRYEPPTLKGAFLELGFEENEKALKVRLNSLFLHTLLVGKTMTGKTHLAIIMAEELSYRRIPHLIVDAQGEFTGLAASCKDVVITKELEEVNASLSARKTVVLDLMDCRDREKVSLFGNTIEALIREKELEYSSCRDDTTKTQFPPTLITIDEAELFAPENAWFAEQKQSRSLVIDIVKRRSKFGLGAILLAQRLKNFCTDIRSQCRNVAAFNLTDPSDIQSLTIFAAYKIQNSTVQSLRQGEACIIGSWVDFPRVIKTREIKTSRTKSLDFESLLGLETEEYSSRKEVGREPAASVQVEVESSSAVCAECQVHCKKITAKGHGTIGYSHVHFLCPRCKDEFCSAEERWMQENARRNMRN